MRKKFTARAGALLSAGALSVSLSVVMSGPAQASVTPDPTWNEIWAPYLTAQSNTMCVDAPGGTTTRGAHLQLFHCHGYASNGAPQRWQFIPTGQSDGWPIYLIRNVTSGLCITATSSGVTQDTCDASIFSEWSLRTENWQTADPNFSLALVYSGLADGSQSTCLAAANSTDSNHTLLVTAPCNTGLGTFLNGLAVLRLG
jgi:hypothetical protein